MKISSAIAAVSSAVALLAFAAGCASTQEPLPSACKIISAQEMTELMAVDATKTPPFELLPGQLILTDEAAKWLQFKRVETDIDTNDFLTAKVYAESKNKDFVDWSLHQVRENKIHFRFLWFDTDGKFLQDAISPVITRGNLPGDIIRLSVVAPKETCKRLSVCVSIDPAS